MARHYATLEDPEAFLGRPIPVPPTAPARE